MFPYFVAGYLATWPSHTYPAVQAREVFKDPITDDGKAIHMALAKNEGLRVLETTAFVSFVPFPFYQRCVFGYVADFEAIFACPCESSPKASKKGRLTLQHAPGTSDFIFFCWQRHLS